MLGVAQAVGIRQEARAMRLESAIAQPAAPAAVPEGCRVADVGFRWDSDKQHHVPTLLIEFDPVPANAGSNAKGWRDRDAVAAMLAATQPPASEPAAQSGWCPGCTPEDCPGCGPAAQQVENKDWQAVARVQSAKLALALNEPSAATRLREVMQSSDWKPAAQQAAEGEPLAARLRQARDDLAKHGIDWLPLRDLLSAAASKIESLRELADSEGTRAVECLRRARRAEAATQPAAERPYVWGYAIRNPKEPAWPTELVRSREQAELKALGLYQAEIIPLVALNAPATQPAEPSELVDLLQRAVRRLEIEHSHGGSIMREWITEARAALAQHGAGKAGK